MSFLYNVLCSNRPLNGLLQICRNTVESYEIHWNTNIYYETQHMQFQFACRHVEVGLSCDLSFVITYFSRALPAALHLLLSSRASKEATRVSFRRSFVHWACPQKCSLKCWWPAGLVTSSNQWISTVFFWIKRCTNIYETFVLRPWWTACAKAWFDLRLRL